MRTRADVEYPTNYPTNCTIVLFEYGKRPSESKDDVLLFTESISDVYQYSELLDKCEKISLHLQRRSKILIKEGGVDGETLARF